MAVTLSFGFTSRARHGFPPKAGTAFLAVVVVFGRASDLRNHSPQMIPVDLLGPPLPADTAPSQTVSIPEILIVVPCLIFSLIPVVFVWSTLFSFHLSSAILAVAVAGIGTAALVWFRLAHLRLRLSLDPLSLVSFSVVLAVVCVLRFANIRGLVLPLWVDSVHHSALAHLISQAGLIPNSYRPFAATDGLYYHIGYHTLIVALFWFTGVSIEQLMLYFGQLLNVMAPVALYTLAARWTRSSIGGLTAMVIAGTLSLMPAYYVTWGRYTQLEGLVILPVAILLFDWSLMRGGLYRLVLAALLASGLFLIHYRVVAFFVTYVAVMLTWQTVVCHRKHQPVRPFWLRTIIVAFAALVLSAPWLWRVILTAVFPLDTFVNRFTTAPEGNLLPYDLLTNGSMPVLITVASLSVLLALRSSLLARYGVIVPFWLILTAIIQNPAFLGLPLLWILQNFASVIALFVPLSLIIGCGVCVMLQAVQRRLGPARVIPAAHLLLVLAAIVAAPFTLVVVNPATVLFDAADQMAMDWIKTNTPQNAVFLVNERLWLAPIYTGSDGGYWIPNLTGRLTTMPIVFYQMGPRSIWHDDVNVLAQVIAASPDPDDAAFLNLLRQHGVTYVYIGVKGGPLRLDAFQRSKNYTEVHAVGGAYIFKANAPP